MEVRLLEVTLGDPYSNLAAEEAIFRLMDGPAVRIWENQECVVIGRAQLARLETDLDYCAAHRVPVVRRFTAGGAVYNGPGNLNWSFFVPKGCEGPGTGYSADAKSIFSTFARILQDALAACMTSSNFEPPNNIVSDRGKISGMAAYISRTGAVCHGTLLLNADLELVERLTKPSCENAERKYPRSNFAKVANSGVGRDRFVRELTAAAGADYQSDKLSRDEEEAVSRLLLSRYGTDRWNLGDPFSLDYF